MVTETRYRKALPEMSLTFLTCFWELEFGKTSLVLMWILVVSILNYFLISFFMYKFSLYFHQINKEIIVSYKILIYLHILSIWCYFSSTEKKLCALCPWIKIVSQHCLLKPLREDPLFVAKAFAYSFCHCSPNVDCHISRAIAYISSRSSCLMLKLSLIWVFLFVFYSSVIIEISLFLKVEQGISASKMDKGLLDYKSKALGYSSCFPAESARLSRLLWISRHKIVRKLPKRKRRSLMQKLMKGMVMLQKQNGGRTRKKR